MSISLHQRPIVEANSKRRGRGESIFLTHFLIIILLFGFATLILHYFHANTLVRSNPFIDNFWNESLTTSSRKSIMLREKFTPLQGDPGFNTNGQGPRTSAIESSLKHDFQKDFVHKKGSKNDKTRGSKRIKDDHRLAGLNCDAHGGPSEEIAREMVYWEDIPSDATFVSPFKRNDVTQYLTFDPDIGGWNNVRMNMENVIALALAMGRTLVLPPIQGIEHLILNATSTTGDEAEEKRLTFLDIFPLEQVSKKHLGLDIITMQEFLEKEALAGKLRDVDGQVVFPPDNLTDWDGVDEYPSPLSIWLREKMHETIWDPNECIAVFPASSDPLDVQTLIDIKESVEQDGGFPSYEAFIGKPSPVNASAKDRMMENWANRSSLCVYNEEMQDQRVVHFPNDMETPGARMLVHFYAFIFFQDWRQDLWMKRFMRDHIRYVDQIQCAAARIVHAVRQRALENGDENGDFDTFHVRRGDFGEWFDGTDVEAEYIYNITKQELTENATIYIATDEMDRSYFDPLAEHYWIYYIDDFMEELDGVDANIYGMIDQLVAARGRKFFGCWFSTFTGFINRLRGYHANRERAPGYEQGILNSWYYAVPGRWDYSRIFYGVKRPFHAREFPAAWRLIDTGIGELGEPVRKE